MSTRILHARALLARAVLILSTDEKETYNMQTHYPIFHTEYWVYALAVFVIIVLGTLLNTVDRLIKFFSWFCRSFTLASTSDDARRGLCSPVRLTVPPSTPDIGGDG
jgi:hypothetical protein